MMSWTARWFFFLLQITRGIMLVYTVLVLSGCTLSVTNMLPEVNKKQLASTHETLRVGQVREGNVKTDIMHRSLAPSGTITPGVFEDTLYQALERSGIFARVVRSGEADLHLDAELVSQEMSTGYPMTATLFVRYRLTDTHSGQTRWEKSVVSIGQSPASEGFRDRQKLANERAVQENLKQLLIALSSVVATTKGQ